MLEKKIFIETGTTSTSRDMGNSIPPYYPNFSIENWYNGNESFFYNVVNNEDVFIQFGKDAQGWASARFYSETVEITNEEELENGTIIANIRVTPKYFKGFPNSVGSTGVRVEHDVFIGNDLIYSFRGNTRDSIDFGEKPSKSMEVSITPQQTNSEGAFRIKVRYPDGEFTDGEMIVGIGLFNPNPLTYVPMAIRKSGVWKDFDRNNGKIKKRVNNIWRDFSEENLNTSKQVNKGKNRIRKSSNWKQLPPMRGGNTI